jgi:two-component system, cell cycle sensor histidine kinase DivJ
MKTDPAIGAAVAGPFDLAQIGPDLYSLHRASGELVWSGANAKRVLHREPGVIAAKGFLKIIHVQDRVVVACAFSDCLAARQKTRVQFRVPATDGQSNRWFELRCEPAPDGLVAGEGELVLAVTRDISERRQIDEDMRLSHERAESASVAKSLFLANMSHELRTPLNAILGFSELLQSDVMRNMPPERNREYVGLIHSSASHLLTVLTDILDMSKIEAGKYEIFTEPFKIGHTLKNCCAMMRGQADQKQIEIITDGFEALPEVTADERAVKQIMINLLSNAVKFTQDGGQVKVSALRVGRNIRISVSDNGIGISAEHLEHLGMPFYQADSKYDRKYQGTGLGLSVVRGLVELHRGKLSFASRKGQGTTVTVCLPLSAHEARPVPANEEMEVVRLHHVPERAPQPFSIARRATQSNVKR